MTAASALDPNDLARRLSGDVHIPGDPDYSREVSGFNLLTVSRPDLVVVPADEADVQATVRWAVEHGLTVHPEATGHGAYRPLEGGVMLKTHRLNHLTVDAENQRFTAGAGLTWQDVLPSLQAAGLAAVTGSSATVSVVGLLLGGGIGPLSRTLGVAADYAEAFRVVDATGAVLVVDEHHHQDLFWALRGGKVGLGIVTEATVRAVPMTHVYGGSLFYAAEDVDAMAHAWLDWAADLPEAANTSIAILRLPPEAPAPLGGATVLHVRFAYVDPDAMHPELREHGAALLAPLRKNREPMIDAIDLLPVDRVAEIHSDPTEPMPVWEWGDMLAAVDHALLDGITERAGGGVDSTLVVVELRLLGGAIARDPKLPSAVGARGAPFSLLTLGVPIDPVAPLSVVAAEGHAIAELARPQSFPEINYHWAGHPSPEVFAQRLWHPSTGERLAEIRARVDPDRVFEFGN